MCIFLHKVNFMKDVSNIVRGTGSIKYGPIQVLIFNRELHVRIADPNLNCTCISIFNSYMYGESQIALKQNWLIRSYFYSWAASRISS